MNGWRRILSAILACLLLLGLTACGGGNRGDMDEATAALLVQGNLDEIYRGEAGEDYLALVDTTAQKVAQSCRDGLALEAEFFCGYFGIEFPSEEIAARIVALYREIYSQAQYTVGEAKRLDENTYTVAVEIRPINIMEQAIATLDDAMTVFNGKYANASPSRMTEEEYAAYDADWADAVINMVQTQVPRLAYREAVSVDVQVTLEEDNVWRIRKADMDEIDEAIIYYPDL